MGMHRFLHTLNLHSEAAPVISYDPAQVGSTWAQLHTDTLTRRD
jgi:hypothetical protein